MTAEQSWLVSPQRQKNLLQIGLIDCGVYGAPSASVKRRWRENFHWPLSVAVVRIEWNCRLRLKCDGTSAKTRFVFRRNGRVHLNRRGASVQSTTGRRAVHISLQGLYCSCKPVFCSHVTLTGYPLHSLVSPSLLHCVTVCHHISTGLYYSPDAFMACVRTFWLQLLLFVL